MKILKTTIKLLFITLALHGVALKCLAKHLDNTSELITNLPLSNHQTKEISAPYLILANTTFTKDLDIYRYKKRLIKIINNENIEDIKFGVSFDSKKYINKKPKAKHFPWWLKSAPDILKKLDFSKVDGKAEEYTLGYGYILRLSPSQGHWGKVYILEHFDTTHNPTIICAVKVLLTRNDRKMPRSEFLERHREEIDNTIKIARWSLAAKPYGIIKNDADHYLLFLEYGENVKQVFTNQPLAKTLQQIMKNINKMHSNGYAHGDLKLDNMLLRRGRIKLCDWFSLKKIDQVIVKNYFYIGDNLPPEAIRAFYFKSTDTTFTKYTTIDNGISKKAYWLHPIAADRFCFGFSLLEILAKDLYDKLKTVFIDLNPYAPKSLDFWPPYATLLAEVQSELHQRAMQVEQENKLHAQILYQIIKFLDLDPLKRTLYLGQEN